MGSRHLLMAVGMACMCVPALDARGKAAAMEGYWEAAQSDAILDKTLRLRLAPDLSHLSEAEREVVARLLEVGNIMQRLFEASTHHQSLAVLADLQALDRMMGSSAQTQKLLDLYRLFKGPVATDLDNQRTAFLPVDPQTPGRNVYPPGITRDEVEAFLDRHPEQRREILHLRSVVRRAEKSNLKADLAKLEAYPAQDALHPGLRGTLKLLLSGQSEQELYALPYSLAYAEELFACFRLLTEAAEFVQEDDPDLASYLANRARDLLADDYEAGDASWVTGQFRSLNAQIGSYETYDDALFGVKSFFSVSLLVRDQERSRKLVEAIGGLQELQDALPYSGSKKVREAIPV
ncbi:MAG: NUDIX hydrolase, partial [Planctomycetota bacterium]